MIDRTSLIQLIVAIATKWGITLDLAVRVTVILLRAAAAGIKIEIREGIRSKATQASYYAKGRNAAGQIIDLAKVVTYAKPGESKHETGRAVDLHLDRAYREWLGEQAQSLGLKWGGTFRSGTFDDWGHVEWNG